MRVEFVPARKTPKKQEAQLAFAFIRSDMRGERLVSLCPHPLFTDVLIAVFEDSA